MEKIMCPALFVTAPSSDSGKTTVVAAMARFWRNQGKTVRVFKTGPDFIDPKFHEVASGHRAYQLDLGMMGEAICRRHLYEAAKEADLILIEGVMGMFDGTSSSADLAVKFGIPMLAVIPAAKMAQTFGAIAYGLAHYRNDVKLFGVVANKVGSVGHAKLLEQSLPDDIAYCGYLARDESLALPDRHLGLVQADEIADLDNWLDAAATRLGNSCNMPLPKAIAFEYQAQDTQITALNQALKGVVIAVACDAAFAFIYHDNLTLLRKLGATVCLFSPITDNLPHCDALYLPGGYPELHGEALQKNHLLNMCIQKHVADNKPVVAECGGMLYLLGSLTNTQLQTFHWANVLPGTAIMSERLQGIGIVSFATGDEEIKGHCFHYSTSDIDLEPIGTATSTGRFGSSEPVYQHGSVVASYVHWYFPSSPQIVSSWFLGQPLAKGGVNE
ncbi:cobyrinate a,c-diamide synthase [Shewanella algicola]|uniref:cobyrinate a,c-diamide synthase n=1 Tax=Shewanella algicola TaxID=640633 RepID=UPI002494DE1A|nr:cobyrinate a,c-diamide synthase [Shewanella algicola]